jgi:cation diffusion facilitator CzcD-associated flavoprotein CzcO
MMNARTWGMSLNRGLGPAPKSLSNTIEGVSFVSTTEVAIIGAGPYGLATASYLRAAGIEPRVFGEVMAAWRRMPRGGMLLRSFRETTNIGDPKGQRVLVVGAGQSALGSAALASEAGADVEVVARASSPTYLRGAGLHDRSGPLRRLLYPPTGQSARQGSICSWARPASSGGGRHAGAGPGVPCDPPRRRTVAPTLPRAHANHPRATRRGAARQRRRPDRSLDDGTERVVDHLMAATSYHVDIAQYPFLAPELVDNLARSNGFPRLRTAYESSVSGLHFVGAPAAGSLGPGMRFVSHSGMAAHAITGATTSRAKSH